MSLSKIVYHLGRILLGVVFIISGSVKIVDPIGLQIKLTEYFEVFADDIAQFFLMFVGVSLPLSVFFSTLEIVLGVAFILNFKPKMFLKLSLLLLTFFGFLTFYSAYFDKVTDCGCFGDAVKLTPWESFIKDIVFLFFNTLCLLTLPTKNRLSYQRVAVESNNAFSVSVLGLVTIVCLLVAYWGINHLPLHDFRPYAIGKSIPVQMEPEEPCRYRYIMEKDGVQSSFSQYPTDKSYKYIDMEMLNPEKCTPKITDYSVSSFSGEDLTEASLTGKNAFFVIQDAQKVSEEELNKIVAFYHQIKSSRKVFWITSDADGIQKLLQGKVATSEVYFADATVLKAMIRSNPGVLFLDNGVVIDKWHINDVPL